jgi:hypothetical protein
LPPLAAEQPPHRPENEACCVWKNAAIKLPPVRSLPFKTTRFVEAVKKKRGGSKRSFVRASPNSNHPDAGYPHRLGLYDNFVENSAKLICLEIAGYQIVKYI